MERDPPPMPPDASRPSQFATQSVTCAILRGELYVMPLFFLLFFFSDVRAGEGFEL